MDAFLTAQWNSYSWVRTERFVHNCENYRPSESGRGRVLLACVSVPEKEVAHVELIV